MRVATPEKDSTAFGGYRRAPRIRLKLKSEIIPGFQLHLASRDRTFLLDVVRLLLLDRDADAHVHDSAGWRYFTAFRAALNGSLEVIRVLLERKGGGQCPKWS